MSYHLFEESDRVKYHEGAITHELAKIDQMYSGKYYQYDYKDRDITERMIQVSKNRIELHRSCLNIVKSYEENSSTIS